MAKINLILVKGSAAIDITNLVITCSWSGRKGSAARSFTATLIDDDGYKHARSGVIPTEGHSVIFSVGGKEKFRGIVKKIVQSNAKTLVLTAYDIGIYLTSNQDTYTYTNKTASDIFIDVCTRLGLPYKTVAKCAYQIPELIKSKTKAFDVVCDAMSKEFNATGIRHYISCSGGYLSLLERRENILQWVVEAEQNIISYTYTHSVENKPTRITMLSDEGTVLAEAVNGALENKIGVSREIISHDDTYTIAQLKSLCQATLEEKGTPDRTFSLQAIGNADVISGLGVFVIIKPLGISQTFYVDSDTHTFTDNDYTMSLKLTLATDVRKPIGTNTDGSAEGGEGGYKVGSTVQFLGGAYYVTNRAETPILSNAKAGPAKIQNIALGTPHPYFLAHTDNQSVVYGWVDRNQFN